MPKSSDHAAHPGKDDRLDNGSNVLPGAPAVFCDPTQHVALKTLVELADWCKHSGLRPSGSKEVEGIF